MGDIMLDGQSPLQGCVTIGNAERMASNSLVGWVEKTVGLGDES